MFYWYVKDARRMCGWGPYPVIPTYPEVGVEGEQLHVAAAEERLCVGEN